MSRTLDMLEDGFPHGTVAGYDRGCRGSHCPAVIACRDVRRRYLSDMDFRRLVDAGVPVQEIAAIDFVTEERVRVGAREKRRAARAAAAIEPLEAREMAATAEPIAQQPEPARTLQVPSDPRWAIRKAWVAISPGGVLHGPFDEHADAVDFVAVTSAAVARRITPEVIQRAIALWKTGLSDLKIANQLGVSQGTISRRLRALGYAPNGKRFGS